MDAITIIDNGRTNYTDEHLAAKGTSMRRCQNTLTLMPDSRSSP